jgi:peroxiredoxin Q/BCP
VGDKAPDFQALDETGKEWRLSDHLGKKIIVVYFYPADFTGGCTAQACSFRDNMKPLTDRGVEVVGVSGDEVKTHALFKEHHKLPFTLLSDEKGEVAKKFGVPTKPGGPIPVKVDGKEMTIRQGVRAARWTFVIGKDGTIIHKNTTVKPAEDAKQILEVVQKQGR